MNNLVKKYLGEESLRLFMESKLHLPYHPYSLVAPIHIKKQLKAMPINAIDEEPQEETLEDKLKNLEVYFKLKKKPRKCPFHCKSWNQVYYFWRHLLHRHLDLLDSIHPQTLSIIFDTQCKRNYLHDYLLKKHKPMKEKLNFLTANLAE